jgi:hypothetical protein
MRVVAAPHVIPSGDNGVTFRRVENPASNVHEPGGQLGPTLHEHAPGADDSVHAPA